MKCFVSWVTYEPKLRPTVVVDVGPTVRGFGFTFTFSFRKPKPFPFSLVVRVRRRTKFRFLLTSCYVYLPTGPVGLGSGPYRTLRRSVPSSSTTSLPVPELVPVPTYFR
uniref:Putative dynein light chain type 1 n=1 Tax=Ixodes ricinus TaxID=34613 RepID=A0A0K8RCK6_IXORI